MMARSRLRLSVALLLLFAVSVGLCADPSRLEEGGGGPVEEEMDKCAEEEERFLSSEVKVASFDFKELETEVVVTLFIIVVVLAKLIWHHNLMSRVSSNVPESVMLIVVGAFIGGIVIGSFYINDCNRDKEPPFRFTPRIFFFYLLPPIVLESGYFLDNRAFFENLVTICVYAVIGTIFNAFAIGFTLYGLFKAGVLLVGLNVKFTISSALLFGTICSAVDPVAVLAVFDEIHVNRLLHVLVFGESLLNDAVTIVLFQVLGGFANRPFDSAVNINGTDASVPVEDVFVGIAQFIVVVIASIIIGAVIGMLAALITRFSAHVHVLEPIIVFAMGYLSYIVADVFAFSGIVSLITCAIIMKHYVEANISRKSSTTLKYALKMISNVSEMVIFLFLGISLYDETVQQWDWGLVFWTLLFVLLYRPIGVIVLTWLVNVFRVRKIGLKSVFVMSYSGLRGAVAFSLALTRIFEEEELQSTEDPLLQSELSLRKTMLTSVTFLVLFTVIIQGVTIKPLVERIKIKTAKEGKPTLNESIHSTAIDHVTSGVEDILGHVGHNRLREKLHELDCKYLRKIFERTPEARDEQIMRTFKRLQYKESKEAVERNLVFEYHEDREGREGSHVSLHEEKEYEGLEVHAQTTQPRPSIDYATYHEEFIPALSDVLNASFAHPHDHHLGHVLAQHEREHQDDHHFEPVARRRDLLKNKHARRRARRRRRQRWLSRSDTPSLADIEEGENESEIPLEHVSTPDIQAEPPIILASQETDV